MNLLEAAQARGLPTFIWGVGMDDELNPVFFRAQGKRRLLLSAFGLVKWYENRLRKHLSMRIQSILPKCKGIWLRDPESARILETFGYANAKVTADTAAFLPPPQEKSPRQKENAPAHTLGICISTQRQVTDLHGVEMLISEVRANGCKILGIPMNPRTDRELLRQMGVECIEGTSPDDVMAAAATCDLVLSSRLHLLILAANAGTPGIGVARGSKIANWLANFGEKPLGTVGECDWEAATRRVLAALDGEGAEDWERRREAAYGRLAARFEAARAELAEKLKG